MQDVVIKAIKQLVSHKKTPTVALIKGKLMEPVPMPIIINVLNQYKKDPQSIIASTDEVISEPEAPLLSTQSQLDRIEAKLDRLIQLLEKH
ncbi:hypothetical protein B1199_08125 [Pseudoalteromonas ulvae]|uniref:Uncharacterized protein n=2 Tax=Pseudoalteromonas ulvae TaxID=107327 RepID=A0A244CSX1_PSEDV|nr:hypothetical protein [Pseudoalteromonas ulvae]OUL58693.1 hypothetical protein B1199_08125 [Pseudoalteromonas ulvae]